MTTTKSRYIRMAYLLDAERLRRLEELLKESVTDHIDASESLLVPNREIGYSVDFSDGTSRTFSSVEDVLGIENSPKREITSLSLSTPYFYEPIRATIRFRQERNLAVSYDLTGDDREVLSLSDKLDEYVLGLRQWYSPLTRFSFLGLLLVLYAGSWVFANLLVAADYLIPNLLPFDSASGGSTGGGSSVGLQGLFIGGVLALVALGLLFDLLFRRAFPASTFAIGQGVDRHKRLKAVQTAVVTCVLITIPVGLLINYLS
jgi:hypothetical protein